MSVARARSRLANEVKRAKRKPEPTSTERLSEARRDLAAAKLDAYISAVVAQAGPLTPEQKAKLVVLLQGPST